MSMRLGKESLAIGGESHKKLLALFDRSKKRAKSKQDERLTAWADAEDTFKAYIPTTETDAERKKLKKEGRPQYTTIQIPFSYATLLAAHTYYTSVFLSRSPILQVQGRHGESQNSEMAMESFLDYQMNVGGMLPALYVWLMDPGKYGHGIVGHYWDEERISVSEYRDEPAMFLGMPIPGTEKRRLTTTETIGYVGNRLYNVRPQDFLTDPGVPLWRFQEGEFCIRFDTIGWGRVKELEAAGVYFNVREAAAAGVSKAADRDTGSPRTSLADPFIDFDNGSTKTPVALNIHEFFVRLIPRDYGLSPVTRSEIWVLTVAEGRIIIGAAPLGLQHNKFPFDVIEQEVGGYEMFNRGMLEIMDPLNDIMTWLFNSHFFNVRKALNDQFVVDPTMVVMKDLEDPNAGRLIRLKPAAYGKPVDSFIKQFQTVDVTRSHINDAEMVSQFMQRVSGVNDNIMGMVNTGGRKTATEVRSSTSFGVNRQKTNTEWFSACGFSPMTQKLVQNSQQLYDQQRQYRIAGDMLRFGERYVKVAPQDIAGFYDFVPVDGTLPVDRFAQANLWQQMLQSISTIPAVAQQYDFGKIFGHVAQLAGLKNINQFRVQVVDDGVLPHQAAAGNVIPVGGANLNEPGQIPGMGSTG